MLYSYINITSVNEGVVKDIIDKINDKTLSNPKIKAELYQSDFTYINDGLREVNRHFKNGNVNVAERKIQAP